MAVGADWRISVSAGQLPGVNTIEGLHVLLFVTSATQGVHAQGSISPVAGDQRRVWVTNDVCVAGHTGQALLSVD
jgi:hypothetical protein